MVKEAIPPGSSDRCQDASVASVDGQEYEHPTGVHVTGQTISTRRMHHPFDRVSIYAASTAYVLSTMRSATVMS